MSLITMIKSLFTENRRKPRIYINASSYPLPTEPDSKQTHTVAIILLAFNDEKNIVQRVMQAKEHYQAIIVLDAGSIDATPHLAAEAGAAVVLCEPGQAETEGITRCIKIGFSMADQVVFDQGA